MSRLKLALALVALVLMTLPSLVWAQDSTVSALPDVASVTDTDNLYDEQGTCPGVPTACNAKRATALQLKTYILTGTAAGNLPLTGGTLTGPLIGTTASFAGTGTVSPVVGDVIIAGGISTPTFAANGEAVLWSSASGGSSMGGQGSFADDSWINSVGNRAVWVPTGSVNLSIGATGAYEINSVSVLSSSTLGSSVVNSSLTSVGTLAATLTSSVGAGADAISLSNTTSAWINEGAGGIGAPAYTTRSVGTKLILYGGEGASSVDWAIGMMSGAMWLSMTANSSADAINIYGGNVKVANFDGVGDLNLSGAATAASLNVTGASAPSNGMYLETTNTVGMAENGTNDMIWGPPGIGFGASMYAFLTGGPQISDIATSATAPDFIVNRTDATTGFGAQAAGNISAIVGGVETLRWTSAGVVLEHGAYYSGASQGLSCTGTPSSSFASVNGLVTHC